MGKLGVGLPPPGWLLPKKSDKLVCLFLVLSTSSSSAEESRAVSEEGLS